MRLADIRYVCVFMYPTLAHNVRLYSMRLHAKPEPDWSPSQVPFSLSRNDRLLVVALDVVRQGAILSHSISHIPSSTLFSAMNTIAPGDSRRVFPWSDWGPSGSRLLCEGANLPPSRDVFGMSAASMLVISTYGSNLITYAIELYDFNPLAYRRALLSSNEGQDLGRGAGSGYAKDMLVMTPTTFTPCMEGFFAEDVTTYLPYLRRELEVTASYSKYVLPFDRLILGEDSLILMPCNVSVLAQGSSSSEAVLMSATVSGRTILSSPHLLISGPCCLQMLRAVQYLFPSRDGFELRRSSSRSQLL